MYEAYEHEESVREDRGEDAEELVACIVVDAGKERHVAVGNAAEEQVL